MPDAFTQDPRNDVANAQVVASNAALGQTAGATANIPPAQIIDAAGLPVTPTKQQPVTPAASGVAPGTTSTTYTQAYCPVEKKTVFRIDGNNRGTQKFPSRCPSCGYEKLTFS